MDPRRNAPLFAGFAESSAADWRRAAEESLEGAPFEKRLVTRTPEGIDLQPIYSRTDGARWPEAPRPGEPPFLRGAEPAGAHGADWLICQEIAGNDSAAFNAQLRDALQRGQNAVVLTRAQCAWSATELTRALEGVDLRAVPIFAHPGPDAREFSARLLAWSAQQGFAPAALHGGVLADPLTGWLRDGGLPRAWAEQIDETAAHVTELSRTSRELRALGVDASLWTDAGANAAQELGFALASGVELVRTLAKRDLPLDITAPRLLFTFGLDSHFFMQVAKQRAARLVWARAMAAAGGGLAAQRLVAHARTTSWNKSRLDSHVNLLRTTAEAFAGVVGGAAGLCVQPFDALSAEPGGLGARLARNLQIILAEECQLARVADPAGGSWFVETLTQQLAEKAWEVFQQIEAGGGMVAALRAGYPQACAARSAAERIEAIEHRRDGAIGVNLHPHLGERVEPPASVAAGRAESRLEPIPPLVSRRRAEPFEGLRQRACAHRERTGGAPAVFLAKFGPRQQHAARAEFSAGFFAAGGFDVKTSGPCATVDDAVLAARASGAPVVVICSTDETYPALVPPFARALKAGQHSPLVVLAGLPASPELQQQFRAAGVDEFIHLRANCARLLAGIQDRLGL